MSKCLSAWPLLAATGLIAVMLSACSGTGADQAVSNAGNEPTAHASTQVDRGSTAAASSQSSDQRYLYDLMQKPAFASAFAAMDGAGALPAWVRKGGTATPVETVHVQDASRLLAQACKPHACPSEQVALLYDPVAHVLQGVFVNDPVPGTDSAISDQATWTWLGKPDAAVKQWLKQRVMSR